MAVTKASPVTNHRPGTDAIIFRFTVGTGGVAAGDVVANGNGSSGIVACDGNGTAANHRVIGIALQTGAAGDVVDVVTHGPVVGYTGCTVGALIYADDTTAGLPSETAATNANPVGWARDANTVFVQPR